MTHLLHDPNHRVLICGSRDFDDAPLMEEWFKKYFAIHWLVVVHGAARGADQIAGNMAARFDMHVDAYPADWTTHGRAAGPIRNQQMLDSGVGLVAAFLLDGVESRGTRNTIRGAHDRGIHVIEIPVKRA
jgi:hypothetical protein